MAVWAGQQRDSDGYLTSDPGSFATDTYAITAPSLHLDMTGPDLYGEGQLGELRVQVQPAEPGAKLFVGIGPADDVAGYLDPVNHVEVSDLDAGPFVAGGVLLVGGIAMIVVPVVTRGRSGW